MDSGEINYNFSHFDDDVGKEPGDLTVDSALTSAGSSTLTTTHSQSVLSHQELADISQVGSTTTHSQSVLSHQELADISQVGFIIVIIDLTAGRYNL